MFEPGDFVAQHIDPVRPEQVQPNGVDLTLERVFEPQGIGQITRTDSVIADRDEYPLETSNGTETYTLLPDGYVVRYGEQVRIPTGHIGFIYPRSSLLRNGCMLNTAVWDAGYEGRGEGLLQVHQDLEIERGARIAQIVFAKADHTGQYEGSYQGENL